MIESTTRVAYRKSNCRLGFRDVPAKPARTVALLGESDDGSLDLRITQGRSATFYRYSPNAAGWTVDKWDQAQERIDDTYVINRANGRCTCPDGQRRHAKSADQPCKHIAALSALLRRMDGGQS